MDQIDFQKTLKHERRVFMEQTEKVNFDSGELTIVFGGQWGSEGKGEIAAYISKHENPDIGIRIGGPNAGHTSYDAAGNKVMVQSLPTPSAVTGAEAVIGAEGAIIPSLLASELRDYTVRNDKMLDKLIIDNCAVVIDKRHMEKEKSLKDSIGSTGEGVGAATADKVMRTPGIVARDNQEMLSAVLGPFVNEFEILPTVNYLNMRLSKGAKLLLEGTQGLRLGLHTSDYYPFCTSRECSPVALLAGTGLNWKLAARFEVVMVVRTYPIRVGGNSGPLPGEISWEELQRKMAEFGKELEPEKTTVTKKVRRIARINWTDLYDAIEQTSPDCLAVTFLDYEFPQYSGTVWGDGCCRFMDLPSEIRKYLSSFFWVSGTLVKYINTGPNCVTKLLY